MIITTLNIDPFEGLPYKHAGYGFDGTFCWGLVYLFYREALGIELPRYDKAVKDYKNIGDAHETFEGGSQDWIKTEEPHSGDVALIRRGGRIAHCGIYIEPRQMLHIQDDHLSCVTRLDSPLWKNRIYGYYRHRLSP